MVSHIRNGVRKSSINRRETLRRGTAASGNWLVCAGGRAYFNCWHHPIPTFNDIRLNEIILKFLRPSERLEPASHLLPSGGAGVVAPFWLVWLCVTDADVIIMTSVHPPSGAKILNESWSAVRQQTIPSASATRNCSPGSDSAPAHFFRRSFRNQSARADNRSHSLPSTQINNGNTAPANYSNQI